VDAEPQAERRTGGEGIVAAAPEGPKAQKKKTENEGIALMPI